MVWSRVTQISTGTLEPLGLILCVLCPLLTPPCGNHAHRDVVKSVAETQCFLSGTVLSLTSEMAQRQHLTVFGVCLLSVASLLSFAGGEERGLLLESWSACLKMVQMEAGSLGLRGAGHELMNVPSPFSHS